MASNLEASWVPFQGSSFCLHLEEMEGGREGESNQSGPRLIGRTRPAQRSKVVSDGDGQVRVLGGEGEHNGSLTEPYTVHGAQCQCTSGISFVFRHFQSF